MRPFDHETFSQRIVFGSGRRVELVEQVDHDARAVIIADESSAATADELSELLGQCVVLRWNEIVQHVPSELAQRARGAVNSNKVDTVVSIGGGSATGLAKAIALENDVRFVALPTTYAGSECTPIWGLTGEHKQTGRDAAVVPDVVIYDPELTVGLPVEVSVASGFNSIAHSVEALWSKGANPILDLYAGRSIRLMASALPSIVKDPSDLRARGDALVGAHFAGVALTGGGTAVHHKLAHTLGGTYSLPHAELHTVLLPHAIAYNTAAAPRAIEVLREELDNDDPAGTVFDLAQELGAPTDLASIGMPEEALDESAERAVVAIGDTNPRTPDVRSIRALLDDAYHGRRPTRMPESTRQANRRES